MKKIFIFILLMSNITFANESIETTYLAGGCYWGLEDLIRKIPGVINTEVGFSGGHIKNPTYADVVYTDSGHVEAVEVTYNPKQITYEKLC